MKVQKDMIRVQKTSTLLTTLFLGVMLVHASGSAQADSFMRLKNVKFVEPNHQVGGEDISKIEMNTGSKKLVTNLPINISQNLEVRFDFSFTGSNKHGEIHSANITVESQNNMIQCSPESSGHSSSSKNKFGKCVAVAQYMQALTAPTTVKLRFNSQGGGGNKYLDWVFNPSPADNEIEQLIPPGSLLKKRSFIAQIVLARPASEETTVVWGLYPKSCFEFESRRRRDEFPDNERLITKKKFLEDEIRVTVRANSVLCSQSSAEFMAWYIEPGERHRATGEPDISKVFNLITPR